MTHTSIRAAAISAATCLAVMLASAADDAHAQCATCATPTVAYAPVVAAPTVVVAPRVGLFDRWRLRRWGYAAPAYTAAYAPAYTAAYAPAYTAAYAPSYAAAYAPAYTAAYAPAYSAGYAPAYTAAYAPAVSPYLTSYAPLQRAVQTSYYQTSYAPAPAPSCCGATVPPQVVLSPVVTEPCSACAVAAPCSACAATAPCSACAASSGYVDQAAYAAPAPGCSTCAGTSGGVQYSQGSTGIGGGPATPAPAIETPAPVDTGYPPIQPGPAAEGASFDAPQLFAPANDQTARAPTVDIHTAVYRRPVSASGVSTAAARPVSTTAVDSSPWQ